MNKCLVILTNNFPFGNAEPFLESEIVYHPSNFSAVIILAQEAQPGVMPVVEVPTGVKCINAAQKSKWAGRLGDLIVAACNCLKRTEAFSEEKDEIGKSFTKRMFLEYFEARSRRQLRESETALSDMDFSVFDEVVIYSYWFFVTARVGMLLKNKINNNNVRLVSRGHRYDVYKYANSLGYLPMRKSLLKSMDSLYVCSSDGCNYLRQMYPEFAEKIKIEYLGTQDFGMSPHGNDEVFRIVSCSRAVPVKRIERIISALKLLEESSRKLEWVHLGSGRLLKGLKKSAEKELGFMNCEFKGALPNKKVLEYYKNNQVNLFVNVSDSEGLPVSIMEAMSFGIPAVAPDVGGTREAIVDGKNGRLLPSDFSDEKLAETISEFAAMDKSSYDSFCANTRDYWEQNFRADSNHRNFSAQLYKGKTI